jgi:hypothetical protein
MENNNKFILLLRKYKKELPNITADEIQNSDFINS